MNAKVIKKVCIWCAIGIFIAAWLVVSYSQFRSITSLKNEYQTLQQENRILQQNGRTLIFVNAKLFQNVSNINNVIIEKAAWDKEVATKIRELDGAVKDLYEKTTKNTSQTIPRVQ